MGYRILLSIPINIYLGIGGVIDNGTGGMTPCRASVRFKQYAETAVQGFLGRYDSQERDTFI